MQDAGLDVEEEWFGCTDYPVNKISRRILAPTAAILLAAAICLKAGASLPALFLALLSFVPPGLLLQRGRKGITGNLETAPYRCANLVGRLRSEKNAVSVVLMAHYDSKSRRLPIWLQITLYLLGAAGGGFLLAFIVVGALLKLFNLGCPFCNLIVPASIVLLFVSLVLLVNTTGNGSDGALDNATGIGIISSVAEKLRQEYLEGVDLWVTATAAEEIGLWGARDFLERHKDELSIQNTVILNFDGCGAKRTVGVLESFGIPPWHAPQDLILRLEKIACDKSIALKPYSIPLGMATDLAPFRKAGYKGLDFISAAGKSHTPKDTIGRVKADVLGDYVIACCELIKRL